MAPLHADIGQAGVRDDPFSPFGGRFGVQNRQQRGDHTTVGDDHPVCCTVGHFDVGGDRPGFVEHRRSSGIGHADSPGEIGHALAFSDQARAAHQLGIHPLSGPPVER